MPVSLPSLERFAILRQETEGQAHPGQESEQTSRSGAPPEQSDLELLKVIVQNMREWGQPTGPASNCGTLTGSRSLALGTSTATSGTCSFRELGYLITSTNFWYACAGGSGDPTAEELDLEHAYQQIGWWKGPQLPQELRRESQAFWAAAGEKTIRWLVARLRRERNIEVLHGAASLLASPGQIIVTPILDELDGRLARDNGLALLGALSKLPPAVGRFYQTRLSNTLHRYLRHPSPELREAAAVATSILSLDRAVRMLQDALRAEAVQVVRGTLEDAIADRQEEQE